MTMFGLKDAEVATLVRAVAGEDLDREQIRDRFARATWTGIAEPGDGVAGIVVEALGSSASLEAVVARWPVEQWDAAVRAAGVDDLALDDIGQAVARWQPRLTSATALLALRQAARYGARLLTKDAEHWPAGVNDLGAYAPLALWVRGNEPALAALGCSIALVGARAATGYGEHVAMEASAGLVDRGYAIVSGAAYGIDGMAHRAALASRGQTIAFLAGGVDRFYPSGHDALLNRIVEAGAVISELPCGAPPTKWRFLQRNRLIAAASQATVVLEAGWRSGSLNTANHAAHLGRPVGAVPGPVTSAASAGCHRLIREARAVLVTSASDMAELMPDFLRRDQAPATLDPIVDAVQTRALDAMSFAAPRTTSDIAARSGLSVAEVQGVLGALELEGTVRERERGWTRRKSDPPTSGDGSAEP
jgi:DNA processing protein